MKKEFDEIVERIKKIHEALDKGKEISFYQVEELMEDMENLTEKEIDGIIKRILL